nr:hypothetical protein [Candidatus Bathyarchaeota archaeon]
MKAPRRLDVLVDGSNVVMYVTDSRGRGKTSTLKSVISELEKAGLGFFVLFDGGIRRKCDNPRYIGRVEEEYGFVVPGHREADLYLLYMASRVYDCYVLSRDKFAEYQRIYPSLRRRRISYVIEDGRLKFTPSLEEVKRIHERPSSLTARVNVECSLNHLKEFLSLTVRERMVERHLRSRREALIERGKAKSKGFIRVEAKDKKMVGKAGRGRGKVMLVEAKGVKQVSYSSKSGLTNLTWTPYPLNPDLGRLTGYASPRTIVMLTEAECINVPQPVKGRCMVKLVQMPPN